MQKNNPTVSKLALIIAATLVSHSLTAETIQLDTVEVAAQREAGTAQVVPDKQNPSFNLKQFFTAEPGVRVSDAQRARGNSSVNIRGLSGNRVGITIDGIPIAEGQEESNVRFATLGQNFGRGEFIETSGLRAASIHKNGSNSGLAGSVDFQTLSASDVIKNGNAVGGFSDSSYQSASRAFGQTLAAAAQNARWKALVLGTYRQGHETETMGKVEHSVFQAYPAQGNRQRGGLQEVQSRTKAEPADYHSRYLLTKIEFLANNHHRFQGTFEYLTKSVWTQSLYNNGNSFSYAFRPMSQAEIMGMLRGMGISGASANLVMLRGLSATEQSGYTDDRTQRTRFSLSHFYDNDQGWLQKAVSTLYYQDSNIDNFHLRRGIDSLGIARTATSDAGTRDRNIGFSTALTSLIGEQQILRYGFSLSHSRLRNHLDTSAEGNKAPNPNAKVTQLQAYLEGEMLLGNVSLIPHLAFVHYRFKPQSGNGYVQSAAEIAPAVSRKESAVLPKLTLEWNVAPLFKPYVTYAMGIKMPSSQSLVMNYTGTAGYAAVGNPNLKPEKSNNVEIGIKGGSDRFHYELAGYYNRYKNFIALADTVTTAEFPLGVFSYTNKDKVRIYGVELKTHYQFTDRLAATFSLDFNRAKGENGKLKESQPLTYKTGLNYRHTNWGANLDWAYVQKKLPSEIVGSGFYSVVDIGAYVKPLPDLTLSAGIHNLFDKRYWHWADVSHKNLTAMNADAFSAPGRNYRVALRYEF